MRIPNILRGLAIPLLATAAVGVGLYVSRDTIVKLRSRASDTLAAARIDPKSANPAALNALAAELESRRGEDSQLGETDALVLQLKALSIFVARLKSGDLPAESAPPTASTMLPSIDAQLAPILLAQKADLVRQAAEDPRLVNLAAASAIIGLMERIAAAAAPSSVLALDLTQAVDELRALVIRISAQRAVTDAPFLPPFRQQL